MALRKHNLSSAKQTYELYRHQRIAFPGTRALVADSFSLWDWRLWFAPDQRCRLWKDGNDLRCFGIFIGSFMAGRLISKMKHGMLMHDASWCRSDLHESIYTYIYIIWLYVYVGLFVCLPAWLLVCLFGCLSVCLFASLFVCLSLFGSWSLFVSIVFFIWLFAYISSWFQLSIYLHVYLQKYFMHPNLVEANQSTVVQSYPMNSSLSLYTSYVTILEGFIDGELRKSQPL